MKFLLLFCFLFSLAAGGVDFLRLKPDFSRSDWRELLMPSGTGEPSVRGNALELPPGALLATQRFPLVKGEIKIKAGVSGAVKLKLAFYRAGSRLGELPVAAAASVSASRAPANSEEFRLEIAAPGPGNGRLSALELRLAVDGAPLTGDPFFRNALGRDHWLIRGNGRDWDNLSYGGPDSGIRIESAAGPAGGNILAMTDTGTVNSATFPYAGEKLLIGVWLKQENLRKDANAPAWAYATVQAVLFDRTGREIGHCDLTPLAPGDMPWKFYWLEVEPGSWSRQVDSFGLYIRVFDGAHGTLKTGMAVAIRQEDGSKNRRPYNAAQGTLRIDAARPGKLFTPLWQAADMSYAVDTYHPSMRYALAELRRAGVRQLRLREFMQGLRIVKNLAPDGSFELDFTNADRALDYVVRELGFDLTVTVESSPNQLSVKPDPGDPYANSHPPRNNKVWGNIVKAAVNHWIDRYGRDAVARWSFECWNEPNSSAFFKGTDAQFTDLFQAYLEALTEVEAERNIQLNIGTMSAFEATSWFFNLFERARSTGKLDRIDFISFHLYAGFIGSLESFTRNIDRMRRIAAEFPPMDKRPLYLTEYNANTMNDAKLDTGANAAFAVKVARLFLDSGIERAYFFCVCDHLYLYSGRHFEGGLGLFTASGIPKPAFNAVALLNRLTGNRRLPVSSSNDPFDAVAGVDENGTVRVLLTTFDELQPEENATAEVRLELDWTGRSRNVAPQLIRVDSAHANSHAAYQKAGSPTIAAHPDVTPFRRANEMKPEPVKKFRFAGNKLLIDLEPELNSVTCVEIASPEKR